MRRFCSLLLLFFAIDAHAALTVVHTGTPASNNYSATPSISWTLSPLPTVGNSLIVVVSYINDVGQTGTLSIADNQGTTANWQQSANSLNVDTPSNTAENAAIFLLPNITASSGSFTITVSAPASTAATFHVNHIEVSSSGGISLDRTGTYGSGTSYVTSASVTAGSANANAADLIVSIFSGLNIHSASWSDPPSASYTSLMAISASGNDCAGEAGQKNVTSVETSSAAVTIGTGAETAAAIATFYAPGGAPAGHPSLLTLGVAKNIKPHPFSRGKHAA